MSFLLTGSKELSFEKLLAVNGGYAASGNCGGGLSSAPTYGVGCTSNTCSNSISNFITITRKEDFEIYVEKRTAAPWLIVDPGKATGYLPTNIDDPSHACTSYPSPDAICVKEYPSR